MAAERKNESLHVSVSHSKGKILKLEHCIICMSGERSFSVDNKNVDSEAQATANRKNAYVHTVLNSSQLCHYMLLAKTTRSIQCLYFELCVGNLLK